MTISDVKKGVVKWFDSTKGFGFIQTEEGVDIFVHYTGIPGKGTSLKTLQQDQKVMFEVVEGKRGLQAVNVRVIEE